MKTLKSSYILDHNRKIDEIYQGLQYGGKQKSVALLVYDLEI